MIAVGLTLLAIPSTSRSCRRGIGRFGHPRWTVPMVAMRLTLARSRGYGLRRRRRRRWLCDAGRAMPMVAVGLALPSSCCPGRIRLSRWRRCRLCDARWTVPMVAMGLALPTSCCRGRICLGWWRRRRLCNTWRAVPMVTVRFALPGCGSWGFCLRGRWSGWFWYPRRTMPVVTVRRAAVGRRGTGVTHCGSFMTRRLRWRGSRLWHTRWTVPMVIVGCAGAGVR